MDIVIRELQESDSSQVTELYKDFGILMDQFENGIDGYTGGYYQDDSYKEAIFSSEEEEPIYIAEVGDKIVGYIQATFENDSVEQDDYTCRIDNIYVLSSYRKFDIGTSLVNKITDTASQKKADYIKASVIAGNTSANLFFHNLGFESFTSTTYIQKVAELEKTNIKI